MKYMAILAAATLALGPTIASAEPAATATYDRPAPGPVASQATEDEDAFDTSNILLFGGTIAVGAVLLAVLAGDDDDTTTTTTTSTITTTATTTTN